MSTNTRDDPTGSILARSKNDDWRAWLPTRKWWAACISGLLTIGSKAIASGAWDGPEWSEVLTVAAALSVAYLVKNDPTPGGIPSSTIEAE